MGLFDFFGNYSKKELKKIDPIIKKINALEPDFQNLTDTELRNKTEEYKTRYSNGESLDSLLPEAFATVREASVRVLGMRHYDCQLIGGIVDGNLQVAIFHIDAFQKITVTAVSVILFPAAHSACIGDFQRFVG